MADVLDLLPPVRRALHTAGATLGEELTGSFWQLGDDDLDLALDELRAHEARCAWLRMGLVQRARERGLQARTSAPDIVRWLADRYGVDVATARCEVDLALAVRPDGAAAATGKALSTGRISERRARLVVAMLDRLPGPLPEAVTAEAEQVLLTVAEHADAAAVRRIGRELAEKLTSISADGPAPDERGRANEVSLTALEPGWWRLSGTVDAELAAILEAAMAARIHPQHGTAASAAPDDTAASASAAPDERVGREPVAEPDPDQAGPVGTDPSAAQQDGRLVPLPQRRAEALRELCLQALRQGAAGGHGGVASTVLVSISLSELQAQAGQAALLGLGARLDPADARRIACDAGIVPVLLGGDGQPLDHGRTVRACPPGLRRLLDLRDQGCVFPDCGRLPVDCDAHHVVHWADGGTTCERNLCLLCPHHHRQVHRQHWILSLAGGSVQLTPPTSIDPQQRPRIHARQEIRSIRVPPAVRIIRPDRR